MAMLCFFIRCTLLKRRVYSRANRLSERSRYPTWDTLNIYIKKRDEKEKRDRDMEKEILYRRGESVHRRKGNGGGEPSTRDKRVYTTLGRNAAGITKSRLHNIDIATFNICKIK